MPDCEVLVGLRKARCEDERAPLMQIRNDVLWFSHAMQVLTMLMRRWLRGSAVSTLPSVICLTDKNITLWPASPPLSDVISTLSLKSKNMVQNPYRFLSTASPGRKVRLY